MENCDVWRSLLFYFSSNHQVQVMTNSHFITATAVLLLPPRLLVSIWSNNVKFCQPKSKKGCWKSSNSHSSFLFSDYFFEILLYKTFHALQLSTSICILYTMYIVWKKVLNYEEEKWNLYDAIRHYCWLSRCLQFQSHYKKEQPKINWELLCATSAAFLASITAAYENYYGLVLTTTNSYNWINVFWYT